MLTVAGRFARPTIVVGGFLVLCLVVSAAAAPLLAPHDPNKIDAALRFLPPVWTGDGNAAYPLGTDQLGRDVLSRLLYGARTSLVIATGAVLLSGIFGTAVGLVAGYYRGVVDTVLMRLADVQLAFPFILLALAILSVSESRSLFRLMVVLAIADWVIHARVVRGRVLVEREKDYVQAARSLGASHLRVMLRYVFPAILPTVTVIAVLELAVLMLVESILAFLALGVEPPAVSWGSMLADGRDNMAITIWLLALPGAAIFLAVLCVNLLADGISAVVDPRRTLAGPSRAAAAPRVEREPTGEYTPSHSSGSAPPALLEVDDLSVVFSLPTAPVTALDDVSFTVGAGERVGLVGESGSGKTVTALSIMGLLESPGRIAGGTVRLNGRELTSLSERAMNRIRGHEIAMIFQDPGTSLNPCLTVGRQIGEAIALHQDVSRQEGRRRVIESLRNVDIADPERVSRSYPFQLSGGMQQRAMIAMAMACDPQLLIADEPTTALDVTTQAEILRVLDELVARSNTSIVFVTHDLGVVAEFTDRIIVMYGGTIVEQGPTEQILNRPAHPYTQALIGAALVPEADGSVRVTTIEGEPVDPSERLGGCPFTPRCPHAMAVCPTEQPIAREIAPGQCVACHLFTPGAKEAGWNDASVAR